MLKLAVCLLVLLSVVLCCHHFGFPTKAALIYQSSVCAQQDYRASFSMPAGVNDPFNEIVSDFNGDDLPDVAVFGSFRSAVLAGNGKGQFDATRLFVLPLPLTRAVSGDFNGDGILDFAGVNCCSNSEQAGVMLGNGLGRFSKSAAWNVNQAIDVATGDFNGDGHLDLVVIAAGFNEPTLNLSLGDGMGRMGTAIPFRLEQRPKSLTAGDFNGDGKLDLALAHESANSVSLWFNDARERLKFSHAINALGPTEVLAQDFNRDNRADLVVVQRTRLSVFLNNAAGQLSEVADINSTDGSRIIAADFNQDGLPDVAVSKIIFNPILLNNGNGTFTAAAANGVRGLGGITQVVDVNLDSWLDLITCDQVIGVGGQLTVALGEGEREFSSAASVNAGPFEIFNSSAGVGDFNQDGKLDLAFGGYDAFNSGIGFRSGQVNVLLADGRGNYRQNYNITFGGAVPSLVVQDFNRDGRADIAVLASTANHIVVLNGDGTGSFTAGGSYNVTLGSRFLITGDFNADGNPDLALNRGQDNTVAVMLNDGKGVFSSITSYAAGERTLRLVAADFNQDGNLDIAATGNQFSRITVLLGDRAGRFSAATGFTGESNLGPLAAADFNKDGKVDLAVGQGPFSGPGAVAILSGDGRGQFSSSATYPLNDTPIVLTAVDINNDSWPDLAVTNQLLTSGVTFFLNDKKGNLVSAASYVVPAGNPADTISADLNNDGRPDFIVTTVTNGVSLVLSRCQAAPELVTTSAATYRPTKVAVESIATIFGANLSDQSIAARVTPLPTTLAGISVSIKDSAGSERLAPLFFVSPTQINYQIPAGLVDGQAIVVVKAGTTTRATGATQLARVTPGLFAANADGQGVAAALAFRVKADGRQLFEPIARYDATIGKYVALPLDLGEASDQVVLVLFGTGLRHRINAAKQVVASLGGIPVEVLFSGAQPDFIGLDQVNLHVPRSLLGRGEIPVTLTVNGKTANAVNLAIK